MIQRIQTLYLLLASIAMVMTLHFPLATVVIGSDEILLRAYEVTGIAAQGASMWIFICLIAMLALPTLLSIVIIFLFKNRMLQLRLCVSDIVLAYEAGTHHLGLERDHTGRRPGLQDHRQHHAQ